jgi:thiosulfate reductase cytochrome b subunit
VSLETNLQTLLNPLATGGAYQDIARQGVVAPFIVWLLVTSTTNNSLQGASNVQNTRVQIDIYAATQAARQTLADAVVAAMAAASFSNVQLSSQNLYEAEVKLFRSILDFSVWST